jgi:hypothetical protein
MCRVFLLEGEIENRWLIWILESCEKVGISKPVIERFILFYGKEDPINRNVYICGGYARHGEKSMYRSHNKREFFVRNDSE